MPATLLRRIVLMEARAKPRLRNIEGLWRKSTKGTRGTVARPGSMTQYIREQCLLPTDEIDRIIELAPTSLARWQEAVAQLPTPRPEMRQWLALFDAAAASGMHEPPTPSLYASVTVPTQTCSDGEQSARPVTQSIDIGGDLFASGAG